MSEQFAATLTRAQQGDPQAISTIIGTFRDDVRFVCLQLDLDQLADLSRGDLLQDAWLKIWLQIDRFRLPDGMDAEAQFRSWLCKVARNEMLSTLEQRQAAKRIPSSPPQTVGADLDVVDTCDTARTTFVRQEERQRLNEAVARLDPPEREVIDGCFFQGMSVRQFAVFAGISYGAARGRLSRAILQLKQQMGH